MPPTTLTPEAAAALKAENIAALKELDPVRLAALKKDLDAYILPKEKARCAEDGWYWVLNHVKTRDEADKSEASIKTFPSEPALEAIWNVLEHSPSKLIVIAKSRQIMASWVTCAFALWRGRFFANRQIVWQTKKEDDAKDMVCYGADRLDEARMQFIESHLPGWMGERRRFRDGQIIWGNGSKVVAVPEGGNQVRSKTTSLVVIDEAAYQEQFRAAWTAALPLLNKEARMVAISTANGQNAFYEAYQKGVDGGRVIYSQRGLTIWENADAEITSIRLHYTAFRDKDPNDPDPAKAAGAVAWRDKQRKKYLTQNDWDREMEINFSVSQGKRVFPEFSETEHILEPETCERLGVGVTPLRRKRLIRSWDFGWHCYLLDHEILTASGWRPIGEVSVGDRVATLNPETRAFEMQSVVDTVRHNYDGPTYRWQTRSFDLEVTAQHRMFYSRDGGALVSRSAEDMAHASVQTPTACVQDAKSIGEARAVLLGLFLSEGSTRHDGKHYYTWIWQKNKDPWMARWLGITGYPWRYYKDKRGGRGWCTAGKDLHQDLVQYGKATEKFVPDEVKNALPQEIRLFLEAYGRGDGTSWGLPGRQRRTVIYTSSRRMADDLQNLYARIGVTARVREVNRKPGSNWAKHPQFKVSPRSPINLNARELTIEHKSVMVACVSVPNGIVYVRRPGMSPLWCGNSPAVVVGQVDLRDRLILYGEFQGHDVDIDRFAQNVIDWCAETFGDWSAWGYEDFCDPAGAQVRSIMSEKNENTELAVLARYGIHPSYTPFSRRGGRGIIHRLLETRDDKSPALLVARACPIVVAGFLGGYAYKPKPGGETFHEEPDDESYYSHTQACLRYMVTGKFSHLGEHRRVSAHAAKAPKFGSNSRGGY